MTTRKIWMAMLGLALVGLLAACAQTDGMMNDSMNTSADMHDDMNKDMQKNMLMGSDGHHAAGEVSFGMGMGDRYTLTLSDIDVDKIPDGVVYLTRGGDWMHGVEVGRLNQFSGTVTYDLPMGVNPEDYDTVVIWCRQFKVEIGRAHYAEKQM